MRGLMASSPEAEVVDRRKGRERKVWGGGGLDHRGLPAYYRPATDRRFVMLVREINSCRIEGTYQINSLMETDMAE